MTDMPENIEDFENTENTEDILGLLIDYHLRQLSADRAAYVEKLIARNTEIARLNAGLANTFKLLDSQQPGEPAEDLPERIMQAVRSDSLPSTEESRPTIRRIFSFRELVATAASIAIIVILSTSMAGKARFEARKFQCRANLGAVGQGVASYASQFDNQLPYVSLPSKGVWVQRDTGRARRPHLFLLLRLQHVQPTDLICPNTRAEPVNVELVSAANDFPSNKNVSYSFQNLFGDKHFTARQRALRWSVAAKMPIMADRTPLLQAKGIVLRLNPSAKSSNHSGKGQNVLFLDGAVQWTDQAGVGLDGDNIWQAGNLQNYSGAEIPVSPTDTFLAP